MFDHVHPVRLTTTFLISMYIWNTIGNTIFDINITTSDPLLIQEALTRQSSGQISFKSLSINSSEESSSSSADQKGIIQRLKTIASASSSSSSTPEINITCSKTLSGIFFTSCLNEWKY
eukprot:TRINITY_DN2613_c0_g3_i2.p1 TRINITY_DN2613_c0_g3~~TRINITY_DN2613_c0_g3_i2.p1  ORF type:complete len:119 (+),score=35.08 TRINITY_DN2613_c0_g3_i2:201-557(+)